MSIKTNSRHTIFASYGGFITQAIVNNLAPLFFLIFQDTFDIPLSQITLLVTINFLVQLLVDLIAAKAADKIGLRKCVVAAHFFAAAGLFGMAFLPFIMPPFAGLLTSVVIYAVGGGLIEVLVSPLVEACPTENKAGVMSLLHSFYCWGSLAVVLISTLFLNFCGKDSWRVLAACWAVFPVLVGLYFTQVPIYKLVEEGEGFGMRKLCSMRLFWLFVVLMFAAGASELAMSQWASSFAESSLGISKTTGDLIGVCGFSLFMGSARVFYGKMSEKLNLTKFLILSGILCICSYLLVSLSPLPILSLVGCMLCGLSVGILWPGTYSLASASIPKGGTTMFALLALAGDLGCSGGPTAIGFISEALGGDIKSGLMFAVVFPAILIVGALILRKSSKK